MGGEGEGEGESERGGEVGRSEEGWGEGGGENRGGEMGLVRVVGFGLSGRKSK